MPALVSSWRAAWSATPGTTDPEAPFGICTLSSDDSEGAADMGSFRFAQSGSFGVAPNAAMPNTYIAHGYDLVSVAAPLFYPPPLASLILACCFFCHPQADPWVYCGNAPQTKQCAGCDTADPDYDCLQTWYMGPGIHPRLKKPFGQRLAASFLASVYAADGFSGPVTGPTIAGCSYEPAAGSLSVAFNASLLAGGALLVKPYNASSRLQSGFSALVNSTDDADTGVWVALNIAAAGGSSIQVDLAPLQGATVQAIKYAWGGTGDVPNSADVVCCHSLGAAAECVPGQCPIFVAQPLAPFGGHPANPFLAKVVGGKCLCPAPQTCDA